MQVSVPSLAKQFFDNLRDLEDAVLCYIVKLYPDIKSILRFANEFASKVNRLMANDESGDLRSSTSRVNNNIFSKFADNHEALSLFRLSLRRAIVDGKLQCDITAILNFALIFLSEFANREQMEHMNTTECISVTIEKPVSILMNSDLREVRVLLLQDDPFLSTLNPRSMQVSGIEIGDRITRLLVTSAGILSARGYYSRNLLCGTVHYNSEEGPFMLLRETKSGMCIWYIVHKVLKTVYYSCCTDSENDLPPIFGWSVSPHGKYPAPVLCIVSPKDEAAGYKASCIFAKVDKESQHIPKHETRGGVRKYRRQPLTFSDLEKVQSSPDCLKSKPQEGQDENICFNEELRISLLENLFTPLEGYASKKSEMQLRDLRLKKDWIRDANIEVLCTGFEDKQSECILTKPDCMDEYFSFWSLEQRLSSKASVKLELVFLRSKERLDNVACFARNLLAKVSKSKIQVRPLGAEIECSSLEQHLSYLLHWTFPFFSHEKRCQEMCVELEEMQASLERIFADGSIDADECDISMGCVEEIIPHDPHQDYARAHQSVQRLGTRLRFIMKELSNVYMTCAIRIVSRWDIESLCSFHTSFISIIDGENIRAPLPDFPDPFQIHAVQENILLLYTSFYDDDDKNSCIAIPFGTHETFLSAQDNVKCHDAELNIQSCIVEVQKYFESIASIMQFLEQERKLIALNDIKALLSKACYGHDMHNSIDVPSEIARKSIINALLTNAERDPSTLKNDMEMLAIQHNRCRGCGQSLHVAEFPDVFRHRQNFRRCHFYNSLFCKRWCHRGEQHVLPHMLIFFQDTREYSVSVSGAVFLRSVWNAPILDISEYPNIALRFPLLQTIQNIRASLFEAMEKFLLLGESPLSEALEQSIGLSRLYMCFSAELFSFNDVLDPQLEKLANSLIILLNMMSNTL